MKDTTLRNQKKCVANKPNSDMLGILKVSVHALKLAVMKSIWILERKYEIVEMGSFLRLLNKPGL